MSAVTDLPGAEKCVTVPVAVVEALVAMSSDIDDRSPAEAAAFAFAVATLRAHEKDARTLATIAALQKLADALEAGGFATVDDMMAAQAGGAS